MTVSLRNARKMASGHLLFLALHVNVHKNTFQDCGSNLYVGMRVVEMF